jgi:hypothetical protein
MNQAQDFPGGVEAACGRLDELARLAGPELGRWMLRVAERYVRAGCRRRTLPAFWLRAERATVRR